MFCNISISCLCGLSAFFNLESRRKGNRLELKLLERDREPLKNQHTHLVLLRLPTILKHPSYRSLLFSPQTHLPKQRHYGALQGLNKKETVEKHGIEQVNIWRRSYDIPPPPVDTSSEHYPGNDPKYADVPKSELPLTESLKTTKARFLPLWENEIVPDIKAGKRLVIAAHGNTIRALVQHLDGISEGVVCELNVPTGVPLIYDLDENMKPVKHPDAIAPLQGHYLGDQEKIRAKIAGVAAQTGPKK